MSICLALLALLIVWPAQAQEQTRPDVSALTEQAHQLTREILRPAPLPQVNPGFSYDIETRSFTVPSTGATRESWRYKDSTGRRWTGETLHLPGASIRRGKVTP